MLTVFNALFAGFGYIMVTVENTFSDATVAEKDSNCTLINHLKKETDFFFICAPKKYFSGIRVELKSHMKNILQHCVLSQT